MATTQGGARVVVAASAVGVALGVESAVGEARA